MCLFSLFNVESLLFEHRSQIVLVISSSSEWRSGNKRVKSKALAPRFTLTQLEIARTAMRPPGAHGPAMRSARAERPGFNQLSVRCPGVSWEQRGGPPPWQEKGHSPSESDGGSGVYWSAVQVWLYSVTPAGDATNRITALEPSFDVTSRLRRGRRFLLKGMQRDVQLELEFAVPVTLSSSSELNVSVFLKERKRLIENPGGCAMHRHQTSFLYVLFKFE